MMGHQVNQVLWVLKVQKESEDPWDFRVKWVHLETAGDLSMMKPAEKCRTSETRWIELLSVTWKRPKSRRMITRRSV